MKKILLVFSISALGVFNAGAQSCTPGANFADSTYGVWPDTVQNFPPASVGVAYSTDLNFKVPSEVTPEVAGTDPAAQAVVGSQIQEFVVDNVAGLPAGFNYACNIASCTYAGGSNGCANLYGTATSATVGTFPITIEVTATVLVELIPGFPTPLDVPTSFSGYKLIIGYAGQIEGILNPISVHPNPANNYITVSGLEAALNVQSIAVTNMDGQVVKNVTPQAPTMDISLDGMASGMYFVVVEHAAGRELVKFIKE
jgi:hypothetical protein